VILGDGRLAETLEKAGAGVAHAVVAVTGDDAANLGIALAVRELNPAARTVARLFDADFAAKVEGGLGLSAALSASSTAAPSFAAAALVPDAVAAFLSEDRFFAIAPRRVTGDLVGRRPSEPGGVDVPRVVLRCGADGAPRLPLDDSALRAGEDVLVLLARPLRSGGPEGPR
jgi:Trk K+ transport system NAD-binding subunit